MTDASTSTAPDEGRPWLSAVITCYYEEETIGRFFEQLDTALAGLDRTCEVILVNDGSTDGTFAKIRELYDQHGRIHAIIDMFRNAGQLAAWTAGIVEARGEVVLLIDSDLQLDPSELPRLVAEYDKGVDIVSGYRENRADSLTRMIPSKLANVIMRRVSGSTVRDFGCTFKLYNAELLRQFDPGPRRVFNTAIIMSRAGRIAEVPVSHFARPEGRSGWTFRKLWRYNMDNVVNISAIPFQIIGLLCGLFALAFVLRVALATASDFQFMDTVTNGLLLNAILISLLMLVAVLCIVGEFTIRCFLMLQGYPLYAIREIHRRG